MRKIAVLTDSCSDIPQELADKYKVDILCFPITLDGVTYIERQDVTNQEFYDLMRKADGVPSTAALTPLQFLAQFESYLKKEYTDVLLVSINGTGSSSCDNARVAVRMLGEEHPGHTLKVHIVDSHTYSMPYGWYVCEAARKLRNGSELEPVLEQLDEQMRRTKICLAAFSLKQMKKSGRVSAAAAFMGELLGLKPIISLNQGISVVENKVRGDAAVIPAMIKYVQSQVEDTSAMEYQVGYTDVEAVNALCKACEKAFGHPPLDVFHLGGVVSANTGPDAVAITFLG